MYRAKRGAPHFLDAAQKPGSRDFSGCLVLGPVLCGCARPKDPNIFLEGQKIDNITRATLVLIVGRPDIRPESTCISLYAGLSREPWFFRRNALESHWHVTHVAIAKLAATVSNQSVEGVSGGV